MPHWLQQCKTAVRTDRCLPWLAYAGVTALIMVPWLSRGYILTLDMVFTPVLRMPTAVTNDWPLFALLHVLNLLIPSDILQKVLLAGIFMAAGVGVYRLVRTQQDAADHSVGARAACFSAGVLYMINPFTYDRLMAGQYLVLFGYALLPWFMRSLLRLVHNMTLRDAAVSGLWLAGIGVVSPHATGLALLAAVVALAVWCLGPGARGPVGRLLGLGGIVLMVFAVCSSYWLLPLATGKSALSNTIQTFTASDRSAFATVGAGPVGRLGNVLRLQGFWAEGADIYSLPQSRTPLWGILMLVVWAVVGTGMVSYWRSGRRRVTVVFCALLMLGAVLSIGGGAWMYSHLPFFKGYREPEKFVTLLALAYALFWAQGFLAIIRTAQRHTGQSSAVSFGAAFAVLPLVVTSSMLWGCAGQLRPVRYPSDWFVLQQHLPADLAPASVVFLPWHLYMYFDFAGRIIANPGPAFFGPSVIASSDPEFRGASASVTRPSSSALGQLWQDAPHQPERLVPQLAALHVGYVLLAREDDYRHYAYLNMVPGLQRIDQSPSLELYRVVRPETGRP